MYIYYNYNSYTFLYYNNAAISNPDISYQYPAIASLIYISKFMRIFFSANRSTVVSYVNNYVRL